ncbi:MAG: ion channel [Elainellaceae cyanobacterium]
MSQRPLPGRIDPRLRKSRAPEALAGQRCFIPTTSPRHKPRIVTPSGRFDIARLGVSASPWSDLYHWMLVQSLPVFFGIIALIYLLTNAAFAAAYLIGSDHIANARPGSFADAFFFSVQTMASIGYGAMYPQTPYANVIVTIEALMGVMGLAIATGIIFARFSRPTAKIMFSNVAVIGPYDGVPTFMFRCANQRRNRILEAQVTVTLVRNEITREGRSMRRFYDLPLVRSQSPIFALSWTVMHPLAPGSSLYDYAMLRHEDADAELIVTLTGLDETSSQTIHARHSYIPAEVIENAQFCDLFTHTASGQFAIDYRHFHEVMPVVPEDAVKSK